MRESGDFLQWLQDYLGRVFHLPSDQIDPALTFHDLGMDSVEGSLMTEEISAEFSLEVDPVDIYDFPSPAQFAAHLAELSSQGSAEGAASKPKAC